MIIRSIQEDPVAIEQGSEEEDVSIMSVTPSPEHFQTSDNDSGKC